MEPTQQNVDRLKKAKHVCRDCGMRHGDLADERALYGRGICDVCDKLTAVTKSETFNCLYRGLCTLRRRKGRADREAARAETVG